MTSRSVGIDLGTTYSCAISADEAEREEDILNSLGEALTPSVIHISDAGEFTVGKEAKDRLVDDPDRVVVGIKRRMGTEFPLEFAGQELTPEGLSALILRSLADDASRQMGVPASGLRAVVTVPAYFGVSEKEATFAAARIAGLECDQLLPEPVAAVYGYDVPEDASVSPLVYDLGGGTFDVAVVQVDGGDNRVWAVDGESRLGGLDWDSRLVDAFWDQLDGVEGLDDLRYDEESVAAVEQAAETVKRRITGAAAAKERLRFQERFFTLEMTRVEFEERTADLMSRTMDAVDRVLEAATRLGAPPVRRVILVGGSTRMPMVSERLREHLGLPVLLADPDRAVARGAARWAARLLAEKHAGGPFGHLRDGSRATCVTGARVAQGSGDQAALECLSLEGDPVRRSLPHAQHDPARGGSTHPRRHHRGRSGSGQDRDLRAERSDALSGAGGERSAGGGGDRSRPRTSGGVGRSPGRVGRHGRPHPHRRRGFEDGPRVGDRGVHARSPGRRAVGAADIDGVGHEIGAVIAWRRG